MMSLFRKPRVLTLHDWLETACDKLEKSSKERIRTEIEAHYAEAQKAHQERGASKDEADLAALAELGDARIAARRFRKQHLTQREAKYLTERIAEARSVSWLLISYIGAGVGIFWEIKYRAVPFLLKPMGPYLLPYYIALTFITFAVLPTSGFFVTRRRGPAMNRDFMLEQVLFWVGMGTLVWTYFYNSSPSALPWYSRLTSCLVPSVYFLIYGLYSFRVWLKLGKTGTSSGDIQSSDTAAV